MRTFKPGAFEIANRAKWPIVPIALYGASDGLPKRGFLLRGHHRIDVRVLE